MVILITIDNNKFIEIVIMMVITVIMMIILMMMIIMIINKNLRSWDAGSTASVGGPYEAREPQQLR